MIPPKQNLIFVLFGTAAVVPIPSDARTWFVKPDGSGDAPTIQAAVDSSTSLDTIELDDGVFLGAGNRDVNIEYKVLTFRSRSNNAEACIIDCQGTAAENHRAFTFRQKCDFRGLTIRNGYMNKEYSGGRGGAIQSTADDGAGIYDCIFIDNTAVYGGAIWIENNTRIPADLDVQNSMFLGNHAENSAGAVYTGFFFIEFVDCQFIDNTAGDQGGAVSFVRADAEFTRCLFVGNQAREGGAVDWDQWDATMRWCTFVGNGADPGGGAHISAHAWDGGVNLWNCILAFGAGGGSVACIEDDDINIHPICCDIFGNEGGDWIECLRFHVGENANFSSDPLFCDMAAGDYSLSSNSPCAAANNSCGLIGAFDVGCGPTSSESKSWGLIKSLYR